MNNTWVGYKETYFAQELTWNPKEELQLLMVGSFILLLTRKSITLYYICSV